MLDLHGTLRLLSNFYFYLHVSLVAELLVSTISTLIKSIQHISNKSRHKYLVGLAQYEAKSLDLLFFMVFFQLKFMQKRDACVEKHSPDAYPDAAAVYF